MENQLAGQINEIPVSYQKENPSSSNLSLALTHNKTLSESNTLYNFYLLCILTRVLENCKGNPLANRAVFKTADKVDGRKNIMNRHGKKADNIVHRIREHGMCLFHLSFNLIFQD